MCKHGSTENVSIFIPANRSRWGGKSRWTVKPVDRCISDLVRLLNMKGWPTVASCCGHGQQPGIISLDDGRALVILDEAEAQEMVKRLRKHQDGPFAPVGVV